MRNDFRTEPKDVAAWLESVFDRSEVECVKTNDRFAYQFRIYDGGPPTLPTLVITWSAFEDRDLATMKDDFKRNRVIRRLKRNPEVRLVYKRNRSVEVYRG